MTPSETPTSITLIGTITTPNSPSNQGRLINWLLAIAIGLIVSWMAYRFSITLGQVRWSMRIGFCVLIGGLVVYIYFASGLPGGSWLAGLGGLFAGAMATLLGNSLGFAAALIWKNSTQ